MKRILLFTVLLVLGNYLFPAPISHTIIPFEKKVPYPTKHESVGKKNVAVLPASYEAIQLFPWRSYPTFSEILFHKPPVLEKHFPPPKD